MTLGMWSAYARGFLLTVMSVTTLVFALPILFTPLTWARLMGWRVPSETDLTVYLGRCLGAFIVIVEALMLRAGLTGEGLEFTFQVLVAVGVLMVVVHVWGAIQRAQPTSETLEIGLYAGLLALTLMFYPV